MSPTRPTVTPTTPYTPTAVTRTEAPKKSNTNPTDILPDPTPTTAPEGSWALINLICIILGGFAAIFSAFKSKDEDDEASEAEKDADDEDRKKMRTAKVVNIIVGIAAVIVFIITENMSLPMALVDKYTILMAIMAVANIIDTGLIINKANKDNSEE